MVLECKYVWNHISGYLDDALPDEVRESVQRHLDHCEICSAILDSTRNILVLNGRQSGVRTTGGIRPSPPREAGAGDGIGLGRKVRASGLAPPPPSELNGAVQVQVENPLRADEQQRDNCQPDLNRLRAFLLRRGRNHSPLRGGSRPKTPNPPDRAEIYQ